MQVGSLNPLSALSGHLGHIPEMLPYGQQADQELTNKLPSESVELLMNKATLRSGELIEKARALAELWHCRTRQLQESGHKVDLPENLTVETVIQVASGKAAADSAIGKPIANDSPAIGKPYRDLTDDEIFATNVHRCGAPPCPQLALWIGSRQSLGRNPYGHVNPKRQIDSKTHGRTNGVPHPSCE
jgi:hypothetical protein